MPRHRPIRRILACLRSFYLDDSNGASIATRALMQCLVRNRFAAEVLCGPIIDAGEGRDPADWVTESGRDFVARGGATWLVGAGGLRASDPPRLELNVDGVPVTIHRRPLRPTWETDAPEAREFLQLFEDHCDRCQPDVLLTYGGDRVTLEVLARARRRGIATAFVLHNFFYDDAAIFNDVDAVIVPSRFAAEHYRRALGLDCTVLPNLVDIERVRAARSGPGYVTFVNPSPEKGVFAFARIADELGNRRPDIPLLVVESRGSEGTLVGCGLDLRPHGNAFLMAQTADPREFWSVSRIILIPSLFWESQGMVAVEALVNGIPVIASDRGALPETLGSAGVILPLPEHLTPSSRHLPTPEEVAPWIEAVIRLWDDRGFFGEQGRRARAEAGRWTPDVLEPRYVQFFAGLRSSRRNPQI